MLSEVYYRFTYRLQGITSRLRFLDRDAMSANRPPLPMQRRLQLLSSGFLSESDAIYDLQNGDAGDYLSDYARFHRCAINRYPHLLNDKVCFYWLMRGAGAPTPHLFAVIEHGAATMLDESGRSLSIAAALCEAGRAVVKPRDGTNGRGVFFVTATQDGALSIGDQPSGVLAMMQALSEGAFILCERLDQHDYAARIFPHTMNTLRIMSFIDPSNGEPFIGRAVHRFGAARSGNVDNWSAGGLSAPIDLAAGVLGTAAGHPAKHGRERYAAHPDTGAAIRGIVIPGWEAIRRAVTRLAGLMPGNPYIGWDVLVTPNGFSVIEGNTTPDVNLIQVHGPLLADERIRRFYKHHNVIQ